MFAKRLTTNHLFANTTDNDKSRLIKTRKNYTKQNMKKRFFATIAACLLLASCEKVVGDLEMFNHDFELQGTISPTLGVPIAHGSVSVYDLINMVQVTEANIEVGDNGIVTIVYDTNSFNTIDFEGTKHNRKPSKRGAKGTVYHNYVDTTHNSIMGSIPIDVFDNIDSTLNGASIEIDNLFVNAGTYVKAQARPDALSMMDTFHVAVYYDSIFISAIAKDGREERINLPHVIPIDSLIVGEYVKLLDNEDISEVINMRPVEIRYGARMNILFEAKFYEEDLSAREFVSDSIGIHAVDLTSDLKIEFPLATYIKDLSYKTDLKLNTSLDFKDLTIDSSMLFLICDNSLPLALDIKATLLSIDSISNDTVELSSLLDPTAATLASAPVGLDTTGHYSSTGKNHSEIRIPITEKVYNDLLKSNAIRINATLNTSSTGSTANKNVAIKSKDMLNIIVTAKIKPQYPFTYEFENNNGDNNSNDKKTGKKGGVK